MDYSTDDLLNDEIIIVLAAIIGFFLFLAIFVNSYVSFKKERAYIKMEMNRSFSNEEYYYWKRKLRQLYLSAIPLVGRFFR